MRLFGSSVLLLASLALPTTAAAQPRVGDNFLGGRIVDRAQVYLVAGYPDVETGVHLRLGRSAFELTPKVRFGYPVAGFGNLYTPLAVTFAADLRWQVLSEGVFSGAVVASLPVHVGFGVGVDVAAGVGLLHPGFMMTVAVADVVDVNFGLQFEDDLWFDDGHVIFHGALPLIFGAETTVVDKLAVGLRFEGGPAFVAATGGAGVRAGVSGRVRVVTGVAWSF